MIITRNAALQARDEAVAERNALKSQTRAQAVIIGQQSDLIAHLQLVLYRAEAGKAQQAAEQLTAVLSGEKI